MKTNLKPTTLPETFNGHPIDLPNGVWHARHSTSTLIVSRDGRQNFINTGFKNDTLDAPERCGCREFVKIPGSTGRITGMQFEIK